MKIHCLCVVRDEADILRHTLDAALTWADAIYACDNGSTDGTWEILQDYARRFPQTVVLAGRECGPFRNALLGEIATRFSDRAATGDWWCRLDADEIYAEDPRQFLAGVRRWHEVVYAICLNYFFTEVDLERYQRDPDRYEKDWRPDRLRFYSTNYSDVRFVRHRPGVAWPDNWPSDVWERRPAPQRILMRHYDYRSPAQIQRRIRIRTRFTEHDRFRHEKMARWAPVGMSRSHVLYPELDGTTHELWQSRILRSAGLYRDDGREPVRIDWELVPPIWKPMPRYRRVVKVFRRALERQLRARFRKAASPPPA
jgi:glycosyltransferase involved in cell wall biosynthesis